MKELKTIEELESEIKDERLLALFRAFVKALEFKDYRICRKLTILRYLIGKCEVINFRLGIKFIYVLVIKVLQEKNYFYWEIKVINENIPSIR